ncbi:protein EcsC [Actibacterium mucosum KCTC 23349]|uniref:Protein EcsC n=1 Tax=Actibacterium mucosum KCTC 23349 TaxID=1454373 RepID=A0A037ZKD3_9RHOB|nr:EcsC family protein [Actibacterium mucosum]KAJ56002.1 protein EcsC [Actibacterium mucosum KCTC 23349]
MTALTTLSPEQIAREVDALAARYRQANGIGIQILNMAGEQAENLLTRIPEPMRNRMDEITEKALFAALETAARTRGQGLPDGSARINTWASAVMGAAGGVGGLPSAMAELPVTVTLLMRAIQGIAAEYGFDPETEALKADCVQVFAAAGPLTDDDGANTGFLSARVAITGPALQTIVARVAPRLAAALGPKLAAQSVPILGAVAGAGINAAYTRYYQEIAHVQFGLKKLAIDNDVPEEDLRAQLVEKMGKPPVQRAG